ncbi:hypothetical protein [Micromonospora sp. NPDC049107]|uniref:hypothetical protein n=1 Tax=Micromonospora sp. NPDC049107 TaxID=3154349 RepID=UPI0033CD4425
MGVQVPPRTQKCGEFTTTFQQVSPLLAGRRIVNFFDPCGVVQAVVIVTAGLVSSLIPPKIDAVSARRVATANLDRVRVTPAGLAPIRVRSSLYGMAAVDDRGKIWAQYVLGHLGWEPATVLSLTELSGLLVVRADEGGRYQLTSTGHLRIPSTLRHWCGLEAGARVLLVADPDEERLVIHPPASVDAMISRAYAEVFPSDAS